jgi:hypothetical protein
MLLIFNLLVTSGIKTQVIINAPAEKVKTVAGGISLKNCYNLVSNI